MKHFNYTTSAAFLSVCLYLASGCKLTKEDNNSAKDSTSADTTTVVDSSSISLTPIKPKPYTLENKDFTIRFPAEPSHRIDTLQLAENLQAESHAYRLDLGSQVFALIYIDYPGTPQPQQILNEAKAGILSSFYDQPLVKKDSSFEWQNSPTVDLIAGSTKDGLFLHYRLLVVGRRLYQIAISSTDNFLEEAYIQDFFNEFQLKK